MSTLARHETSGNHHLTRQDDTMAAFILTFSVKMKAANPHRSLPDSNDGTGDTGKGLVPEVPRHCSSDLAELTEMFPSYVLEDMQLSIRKDARVVMVHKKSGSVLRTIGLSPLLYSGKSLRKDSGKDKSLLSNHQFRFSSERSTL